MKELLELGEISSNVEVLAVAIRSHDDDDEAGHYYLEARMLNKTEQVLEEVKCDVSYYNGATFLGLDRSDSDEIDKIGPQESIGIEMSLQIPKRTDLMALNVHAIASRDDLGDLRSMIDQLG